MFGIARQGSLEVSTSVLASGCAVDRRGGWVDEAIGCDEWRRLTVRVLVAFTRPGGTTTRTFRRKRSRPVQNCAEGGPNMGFTLTAARLGFACPSGRWRSGGYEFVARNRHAATGRLSVASVGWRVRDAC